MTESHAPVDDGKEAVYPTPSLKRPKPIAGEDLRSPGSHLISLSLTGTSGDMDHSEMSSLELPNTTALPDIDSTLQYLVDHGSLDAKELEATKADLGHEDGLKLGALASFFLDAKQSEKLLASLPCNGDNTSQDWVATGFSAKIVRSKATDVDGWSGLYSISFNAKQPKDLTSTLKWSIPLDNGDASHDFTIDGGFNFVVLWPHHVKGIASVEYKGEFSTSSQMYHAMVELRVMPDEDPRYTLKLSTPEYDVKQYEIQFLELASIFDTRVDFASSLVHTTMPGLQSALDDAAVAKLSGAGFILEQSSSKLAVAELFAEKSVSSATGSKDWGLFNSQNFDLNPTILRVIVDDAHSDTRQIGVELDGEMKIPPASGRTDLELIPFLLSLKHSDKQSMLYEVSLYPGTDDSVSIGHLLNTMGISSVQDLKEVFPGVSNLSNALRVSHAIVGWPGSLKPDYIKLTIALDDWVIYPDVVKINTLYVDVEVSELSSKSPMKLDLQGWGLVTIANIQIECFVNFIKNDEESGKDLLSIQIASQQRPLSLGVVVSHFLGESAQILPPNLSSLLDETTMDTLIIQAEREGSSGWSVSRIHVAVSIRSDINVFSDIILGRPALLVEIENPFDQKTRSVYVSVDSSITMGKISCNAEIAVESAASSLLSMSLQSSEQPVTINSIVSHFFPDYGNVKLPESLAFLAGIGIKEASLTLEVSKGKFAMSEVSLSAISTSSLRLWNEVVLQNVCLHFSKSQKTKEVLVKFDSMLLLNKQGDKSLDVTLLYGGPTVTSETVADADQEKTLVAPVSNKGTWSALAKYKGEISAMDILSSLSGLDFNQALDDLAIPAFKAAVNPVITGLELELTHSAESSSFSVDAETKWLCFSHVRFAVTKTTQWEYSFGFDIDTGGDYSVIPYIDEIKKVISLEDLSVAIFNGELDLTSLRPSYAKLPKQTARGVSLAVAARFALGKELKEIGELLDTLEVYVIGVVSSDSFALAASLTGDIGLFDNRMTIKEISAIVECRSSDNWLPIIGVRGSAILDFGENISKNPIEGSVTVFIRTSDLGLGFRIDVKSWHSMFGIEGMNLDDVLLEAAFPPAQFPVPSTFTIAGKVRLDINDAKISGDVNIYVTEQDLTSSYCEGVIRGLSLGNIIAVFTKIDFMPPEYLDSGFEDLALTIVPKNMKDRQGKPLSQQFKMSGIMKLPLIRFRADIKIEVSTERLHIDGSVTPISIPYVPDKVFSILASPHEDGSSPSVRRGPSIRIHIGDEDKFVDAKISGMVSFLGISNEVNISITETGLKFLLAQEEWTKKGSFHGELNSTHMKLHAEYQFALDIVMPNFSLNGVTFDKFNIFDFAGLLDVEVVWENIAWQLVIGGHFKVFGLEFGKTLTVGADFQDLAAIGKKIAEMIKDTFGVDLVAGLKALGEDIGKALTVLKDFGLSVANRVKILVESCGKALAPVLDVAKKIFKLVWKEVGEILRDLGKSAEAVVDVLKDICSEVYEVAKAVGDVFGPPVKKLCLKVLQEGGIAVSKITEFLKTTFSDAAHEIVDILTEIGYGSFELVRGIGEALETSVEEVFRLVVGTRRRKTPAQLQEQLLLSLMLRANQLLQSEHVSITSPNDLEELMQRHTKARFRYMFGYDYDGPKSAPPACVNSKTIKGCSLKAVYSDGQKRHTLDNANTMFEALNLDAWMAGKAKDDLVKQINFYLDLPPSNDWKSAHFSMGYRPKDTNQNPIQADGMIMLVNGALSEDDIHVTQTIFFYIGVFYEVIPETKQARHKLCVKAYNAASLLNKSKVPVDDSSLSDVLRLYGAESFKKLGPSSQWAQPAVAGTENTIISSLARFEDEDLTKLDKHVDTTILCNTGLPSWATDKIKLDLARDFKTIMTSPSVDSWNTIKIDTTFSPPHTMRNQVASKAVMIWYKARKVTSEDVGVSLVYIYFYGVYYPIMNVEVVLRNDLIKSLSLSLSKTMKEVSTRFKPNLDTIKIYLEQYAREEFYKEYKYDFLNEFSTPSGRHKDEPLYAVRLFQEFEGVPKAAELDQWVDAIIKPDAFPLFKQESTIRQNFRSQGEYITRRDNSLSFNKWSMLPFDRRYIHPTNPDANIQTSGILIFSNGKLTTQTHTIDTTFVYYMGIFYVGDPVEW